MNIILKTINGWECKIPVSKDETCAQLKDEIQSLYDFTPDEQVLIFQGTELPNDKSKLTANGIINESVIYLTIKLKNFIVTVTRQDGKTIDITVSSENTVQSLKENIQRSWNNPIEKQTLMLRDEKLENNKKLSDYGIVKGCFISFFPQLLNNEIKVIVHVESGRYILVKINVYEFIKDLKSKIQQKINIENTYLTLVYQGELLDDDKTIDHYEIETCSAIIAHRTISNIPVITCKTIDGKTYKISIDLNKNTKCLKEKIYDVIGLLPDEQQLIFQGMILEDNKVLVSSQILDKSVVIIAMKLRNSRLIFCETLYGKISLHVSGKETIRQVKGRIEDLLKIKVENVIYNGIILNDHKSVDEYEILERSVINVM